MTAEISLGEYVKSCWEAHGCKGPSDAARVSGVSEAAFSRIADNKQLPRRSLLDKIATGLNADRDTLYMMAGYWPPSFKTDLASVNSIIHAFSKPPLKDSGITK